MTKWQNQNSQCAVQYLPPFPQPPVSGRASRLYRDLYRARRSALLSMHVLVMQSRVGMAQKRDCRRRVATLGSGRPPAVSSLPHRVVVSSPPPNWGPPPSPPSSPSPPALLALVRRFFSVGRRAFPLRSAPVPQNATSRSPHRVLRTETDKPRPARWGRCARYYKRRDPVYNRTDGRTPGTGAYFICGRTNDHARSQPRRPNTTTPRTTGRSLRTGPDRQPW